MKASVKQLSRGRQADGSPNTVDIYVGQQLRLRRQLLNLTQDKLGVMLNLTFQQIQKYEKGENRISAGRLYEIAKSLGVEINYFFPPIDSTVKDPMRDAKTLELIYYFNRIKKLEIAKDIFNLLKHLQ